MNEKSTHKVEVFKRGPINDHPNADRLGITKAFGYTVVVNKEDFVGVDLVAYIPPDSVVPDTPQFAFLKGHRKIRAKKLRGIISQGFLLPAPEGSKEGDDVAAQLGIVHYEPGIDVGPGDSEPGPAIMVPTYDVEAFNRYSTKIDPGEEVIVTEKIHGANARFLHDGTRMWVGSKNEWKRQDAGGAYWKALENTPAVRLFCEKHPGVAVYGEVYGWVQKLRYGAKAPQDVWITCFDVLKDGRFLSYGELWNHTLDAQDDYAQLLADCWVPIIYQGPFYEAECRERAEGKTTMPNADHIREGIVVRPVTERWDDHIGRVQLKIISNAYLTEDF